MSQSTSAMTDRSTQWTYLQQKQQSTSFATYGLDTKLPVRRVDSYGTSSSSHEPQSTFSIESPFDFSQPTPSDYNNGTDFLVPELDDQLWSANYDEHGLPDLSTFEITHESMETSSSTYPHSAGLASHKNPLPSPQLTNTSTPEALSHSKQTSMSSAYMSTPTSEPSQGMRSLVVDDLMDTIDPGQLHTPIPSNPYATSPIIHVSSHTRGDSPARSDYEPRRLSKKRSASNLSQGEYHPDGPESSRSGMLNVPQHGYIAGQDETDNNEGETHFRSGLAPTQRGTEEHLSLVDMQQKQDKDKNVAEVSGWLEDLSLNLSPRYAKGALLQDRVRSRSTGARPQTVQRPILKVSQITGPGLVLEERSDYWYSSDEESNLSLGPDDHPVHPKADIPAVDEEENIAPDADVVPLGPEHYRPGPWRDPYPVQPPNDGRRYQPPTSNLAMAKFNARAREFDTLSRSATWGTSTTTLRRLSDGDQDSILEVGRTRHSSLSKARSRVMGKMRSIKRTPSRGRKVDLDFTSELRKVQSPEPIDDSSSADSQPKPSRPPFGRTKSPSISAALGSAAGSLAAVGAGPANLNITTGAPSESIIKNLFGRVRRKSDVNRSPKSPSNLQTMLSQGGGLPGPNIIPSTTDELEPMAYTQTPVSTVPATQLLESPPITMALSPRPANVVPNMEGFKVQIKELNLMLDDFLLNRTAYDQVRRYKRLVKNRVEHIQACSERRCPSGPLCSALDSKTEMLLPQLLRRDNSAIASHSNIGDSDDEETFDNDGFVTANAFPEGIPLPPATKLPARFECPLCFQVKTFQKPSDWTKHVHEDVQPFTCTFQDCQDPKPFKRKADWVRHENERHRHLEWWLCNINGCTHKCYRKDNFVQHLVREHKRKEPKPNRRANANVKGKAKASGNMDQEDQEFWQLVDECRHESALDPRKESCPFCGNTCTSHKKLSVHVGKHMEQIAMPVLDLVSKRNVTKDTPISPLEPLPTNTRAYNMNDMSMDVNTHLSPFSPSNTSYPNSSATQSPFLTYHRVLHSPNMVMSPAGDLSSGYPSHLAQRSIDPSYMYHNPSSGIIYDGYTGTAQITSFPTFNGHGIFQTPVPFTASEQIEHDLLSHDGFGRVYETASPSHYLPSPEQQFSNVHSEHGILPNQGNLFVQTQVTSHPMNSGIYMSHQQDQWNHQQ